jgi:phage tail tube protein FII
MSTKTFKTEEEFREYIITEARKILKEEKIQNLGTPTDLKMNKNDGSKNSTGAQVDTKGKMKTEAPVNIPKEFKKTEDPVTIKMKERDGGHDEDIATAAKIEGTNSEKKGTETNPFIDGQAKPKVDSKTTQPSISIEADPTKEGGVPGKKENDVDMNKEDKEDKAEKPMTQVLGKGEINKDGFSKGQTDKEVNKESKNEKDEREQKLRDSIKTIQLPESFKNKAALLEFVRKEALKLSKII